MAQPGLPNEISGLSAFDWTGLGKEVSLGAVLGFAVGYAAKKAMKAVLIIVALVLLLSVALETRGIITIHWATIETGYAKAVRPDALSGTFQNLMHTMQQAIPVSGGFALGCVLGFRRG